MNFGMTMKEAARTAHAAMSRESYPLRAMAGKLLRGHPRLETRTDLLNYLIWQHKYERYLEIGVRRRENFDRVRAEVKHGVDPQPGRAVTHMMLSDDFFALLERSPEAVGYDLVFIDGSHVAAQVERDVENALNWLRPGGTIVLHDCNPVSEEAQREEYDGHSTWNGTVWKAWAKFRVSRPDLTMAVVDIDFGCGVITRGEQQCYTLSRPVEEIGYDYLEDHRRELLNLIGPEQFSALDAAR